MTKPRAIAPGEVLGRYVVLQPLGPRAASDHRIETFLAMDREAKEEVALRVIHWDFSEEEERTFLESVERAQQVDHLHVARLRSAERTEEGALVAWDWVPGIDLRDLTRSHGLQANVALGLLGQILQGLAALHERKLPHGDLHPGNVRITPEGRAILVGHIPPPVARPCSRFPDSARILRYAPPEWHAEGTITPASDVYSLGLVLYELFTGHPPLPAASVNQHHLDQVKLNAVLEKGVSVNKAIPGELLLVIRNLLQIEIRQRWQSGGEVCQAIRAILSDEEVLEQVCPISERLLASSLRRHTRSLLRASRNALAAESPLIAAACLQRLGVLFDGSDFEMRVEAAEQLQKTLWFTFRRSAEEVDPVAERARLETLALLLTRGAGALGATNLQRISRKRLGAVASSEGPLARMLPVPEDPATREEHRRELCADVSRHPADDLKLLELATYTPGFHTTDATPLSEMRVDLLMQQGLYTAALYHRATCLADRGEDPMLLESMRDLLDRALEQLAQRLGIPETSSAPPMPGGAPPPGSRHGRLLAFWDRFRPGPLPPEAAGELRDQLWTCLAPAREASPELQEQLVEVLRASPGLLSPCSLPAVLSRLPPPLQEEWSQALLEEDPRSIPGLRGALIRARREQDVPQAVHYLLALGKRIVQEGALPYALDLFQKAQKLLPTSQEVENALALAEKATAQHREAAGVLRGLRAHLEEKEADAELVERLERLLEKHPGYLPALALRAEIAERTEDLPLAAALHGQLTAVALMVERPELARSHLVKLLRCDPRDDDALLALALLGVPPEGREAAELRDQVRVRSGLA